MSQDLSGWFKIITRENQCGIVRCPCTLYDLGGMLYLQVRSKITKVFYYE